MTLSLHSVVRAYGSGRGKGPTTQRRRRFNTTRRRKRKPHLRADPGFHTKAGPVTITRADGTTETKPAYTQRELAELTRSAARITRAQRTRILARDAQRCRYCGCEVSDGEAHIDHVVPRALGGQSTNRNLVTSCPECNGRKGAEVWTPRAADRPPVQAAAREGPDR